MKTLKTEQGLILPILLLVIVLVIVGGYFYLSSDYAGRVANNPQNIAVDNKTTETPTSEAQIMITKDGFVPASLTVAKGQTVTWTNTDQSNHQVISQQTELELDSDTLGPNDSFSYSFEEAGTYPIRDRLNLLKIQGTIIVR